MRTGDYLYFAPKLTFSDVNLDGPELPNQLRERIFGFYIEPALGCAKRGNPFAAGLILVSCIDALARLPLPGAPNVSRETFVKFASENLPSLRTDDLALRFYQEIRCGLVHEARLKNGAQFSSDFGGVVDVVDDFLVVDPTHLAHEVSAALDRYVSCLESNPQERLALAEKLKREFAKEIAFKG